MASTIADPNLRPALEAPPGVTSNLIDPPNQQHAIIITMVVYLALTTPFVLARMYTRHIINRRLWWDDCKSPTMNTESPLLPIDRR